MHTITALTDDGIDKLKDMLQDARITTETWHAFFAEAVMSAPDLTLRRISVASSRALPCLRPKRIASLVQTSRSSWNCCKNS